MDFNSAEAVLMMGVMPSVAAIAATSGDSQLPRVYEENCLFCNETCYTSTYQSSNLVSGAAQARQVIYGAFGIRVDPSFFREFQEGLPLCSPCSSNVGSLNNMEKQLNDLEDKYDRLRSKMARSIIKVLDTSNNCVKLNTAINKSPTKLLQSFKKSEVNTLQQIVYESFHDQALENGDETFDFKFPARTGEPKQYRNKKLPSLSQKPEPKYKIQKSNSHQPTTSSYLSLLKNNSQVGSTTTALTSSKHFQGKISHKQAEGSIKSQNRNSGALAGDSGTDKEMMKNLNGMRKQKSTSGETSKPKVASEMHVSGNGNNEVSQSEDCKNFEGELPNGFKGETITLSMSPKLFREGGYSITGYGNYDDEVSGSGSGDGTITTSKLNKDTTGTEAFEDGSFEDEEDIDEGSLNKYSPTLEITEYNGEVNLSNENHNGSHNENAGAIGENDVVPAADGKELESLSEVSSPAREYHGLVDALEIQQNNRGLYECMFCGKTFIHKYPYRDHLKTHTGEGPRCRICQKIFPKNHNLMLHMRTHTGEKPYECEVCQKGFADKSNLKVHMRVHTGERPYKCDYCNQGFVNSSRLIVHRRLHTGERPFPCDYCSRSFATSNQLSSHVKNHFNENKPFKCTECGRGYTNATSLQAHINVNHTGTA